MPPVFSSLLLRLHAARQRLAPLRRWRPTRRMVLWALATPPALLLLYTLVLIPFTPAISDIRRR